MQSIQISSHDVSMSPKFSVSKSYLDNTQHKFIYQCRSLHVSLLYFVEMNEDLWPVL
jgi:hypothetical protein